MARIVVQGIAGELSGKLGGDVFARNRAGAYVRKNANVLNPNTLAQQAARQDFLQASSAFHNLTPLQKSNWQAFADTKFVSKSGKMPGELSGQNAFVAVRNQALNANRQGADVSNMQAALDTVTAAQQTFTVPTESPAEMPFSGLKDDSGNLFQIKLDSIVLGMSSGAISDVTFTLNADGVAVPPSVSNIKMTDESDNDINSGFLVYMSNAMTQDGLFVNNPNRYLIATVNPFTSVEVALGDPMPFADIDITVPVNLPSSDYQALPQTGDTVYLEVYQCSFNGLVRRVGAETVTL